MSAVTLEVACVPVLADNYVWLVHDAASAATLAIDPGEAEPVLAAARARGWSISQVWITHWHGDHTGGIAGIRAATRATVTGPAAEAARIAGLDATVGDGDTLAIGRHQASVIATPGHTAGHVAYHFADDAIVFTGDTLFAMGCGRLFEGTPADMHASLQTLAALPPATRAYGGHEYTVANARFARHVEPDNADITRRSALVDRQRADNEPTLPTTIGDERATNPFLRAASVAELAKLRAAKDSFRG